MPTGVGVGLPLGSYLSQWSGNVFLDGLDHFVLRELKPSAYLRYMDDFVVFANCPEFLSDAHERIREWLQMHRRLALNSKRHRIRPRHETSQFLGWRIGPAGLVPTKTQRRRVSRRVTVAARKGEGALDRTIASYRGQRFTQ